MNADPSTCKPKCSVAWKAEPVPLSESGIGVSRYYRYVSII